MAGRILNPFGPNPYSGVPYVPPASPPPPPGPTYGITANVPVPAAGRTVPNGISSPAPVTKLPTYSIPIGPFYGLTPTSDVNPGETALPPPMVSLIPPPQQTPDVRGILGALGGTVAGALFPGPGLGPDFTNPGGRFRRSDLPGIGGYTRG